MSESDRFGAVGELFAKKELERTFGAKGLIIDKDGHERCSIVVVSS